MQPARIHCTINGKMSQNTMEDYHYLAEGNAYRSDPKIIHKEATIKMPVSYTHLTLPTNSLV